MIQDYCTSMIKSLGVCQWIPRGGWNVIHLRSVFPNFSWIVPHFNASEFLMLPLPQSSPPPPSFITPTHTHTHPGSIIISQVLKKYNISIFFPPFPKMFKLPFCGVRPTLGNTALDPTSASLHLFMSVIILWPGPTSKRGEGRCSNQCIALGPEVFFLF